MGTTTSTSVCGGSTNNATTAAAMNHGFTVEEAQHLSLLRQLAIRECNDEKRSGKSVVEILWTLSHSQQLPSAASSSSYSSSSSVEGDVLADVEAQICTVKAQHPCDPQMGAFSASSASSLFSVFKSLSKLNGALEDILNDNDRFLETLSNILGDNDYSRNDASIQLLSNVCATGSDDESISAMDVVGLCFDMASISHYLFTENAVTANDVETANATMLEMRKSTASFENSLVRSMANSLLESAVSNRDSSNAPSSYTTIAEGRVTKTELYNWQRKVMPDLFLCTMAPFLRGVVFSPRKFDVNYSSRAQQHQLPPFPTIRTSKEITSQTTTKTRVGEILPLSSPIFGTNTIVESGAVMAWLSPPVFAFASISTSKFGNRWYQIYAGDTDGWTFQSLENSILGYEGPTLLVIQGTSDDDSSYGDCRSSKKKKKNTQSTTVTLGAYTSSKWEKNKRDFFGGPDCFLFQLHPTIRILHSLPKLGTRGGKYMYFHTTNHVQTSNPRRTDDLAVGLGFGGTVRQPRLFVDSHLEYCTVSHQDTSFEMGYLGLPPPPSSSSSFDDPLALPSSSWVSKYNIISLEVYAVGDASTIANGFRAQRQHRDIADAALQNARTVDRAAFVGDLQSGLIENKNFAHRDQVDGRADGYRKGGEGKANGLGR